MVLALDLKWKEPNLSMERGLEEVQHEPQISQHSPCKCGMENVRKKKRKPQIWNPESNGKGSFFFDYRMGIDVWTDFKMGDDSQALTCKSPPLDPTWGHFSGHWATQSNPNAPWIMCKFWAVTRSLPHGTRRWRSHLQLHDSTASGFASALRQLSMSDGWSFAWYTPIVKLLCVTW